MREGDRMCFACGPDNPISLNLDFKLTGDNTAEAVFIPGDVHQGYDGIMHGGLVTTLLDEAMAKVIALKGEIAVTAEIRVRFKHPVRIGERLRITGIFKKQRKKLIFTEAGLYDSDDTLLASATGKFIVADP
ncbi:PaaI family thioesterase [Halothermothrix orenii]|uniref:Acyl-coenzyme A thioesterase THEM4 n=1 Tax=Halothermothrix orenii (strain H 168 / OCM 544 / DSM 9562) TaxID=373903 RepID=B8CYF5_HALOH|nr:PaaI family thioesterase [Halothermothrix orenii]ACL70324.1 thioesterase superfamily protein [Halothermothrix orenii H 168]